MELLNSDLTLKKFNLGGLTSLGGGPGDASPACTLPLLR